MDFTIFYSWQSDTPGRENRSLIEDALDRAVKSSGAGPFESALRVEQDTKGESGLPEVAATILRRIENCSGWSGTGTTYSCLGEAGEAESYMPGSVATRAKATNCSVDTAGFAFFVPITIDSRAFPTGNLLALTKFYGYAQNAGTGTSGFEIWDTRH